MKVNNLSYVLDFIKGRHYISLYSPSDQHNPDYNSILIMKEEGFSFCRIYWFNDSDDSLYIDCLYVSNFERKLRHGNSIMGLVKTIGELFGADYCILWVIKDSWMHEWYKRLGYCDFKEHENSEYIWMRKQLKS